MQQLLSRPRRPRRPGEWTPARAVIFIVTLAASRSVTLAARQAGMSRKSAYALKSRDPAFAVAWSAAVTAGRSRRAEGDKVEEVHGAPVRRHHGDSSPSRVDRERAFARFVSTAEERDRWFARLAANPGRPVPMHRAQQCRK